MNREKLSEWIDENFGNRDGKLSVKDLFKDAPSIALVVADVVMLFAEYRVFMVGMALSNGDWMLAVGFILVSSLPFYLGQIAFVYNSANGRQQWIAVSLIFMGLGVSGYYGLADYLYQGGMAISEETAFRVAVNATIALIILGLTYALVDDKISARRKLNRLQSKADEKVREMDTRQALLERAAELLKKEDELRKKYGDGAVTTINKTSFSMASDTDKKELDKSKNA